MQLSLPVLILNRARMSARTHAREEERSKGARKRKRPTAGGDQQEEQRRRASGAEMEQEQRKGAGRLCGPSSRLHLFGIVLYYHKQSDQQTSRPADRDRDRDSGSTTPTEGHHAPPAFQLRTRFFLKPGLSYLLLPSHPFCESGDQCQHHTTAMWW